MLVHTTTEVDPTCFVKAAVLVTRPGQAPELQWIVDTSILGPELTTFYQEEIGSQGTLVQHDPVKGAPRGYTELRVAVSDVAPEIIEQLPRRLRAAIMNLPSTA